MKNNENFSDEQINTEANEPEEGMRYKRDPFRALEQAEALDIARPLRSEHDGENESDRDTFAFGSAKFTEDPTEEQRPTMLTKRVSWVDGTAESKSAHIAISIPRHRYIKTQEYIVYVVELWRSGRSWSIRKRYSEFFQFHEDLVQENLVPEKQMPKIPPKRWLNWLRWSNRFDEKFTWQRRTQLQEYIRSIVKIDVLVEESRVLHNFLEINRSLAIDPALSRDSADGRNSFYYDIATLMGK